MDHQENRIRRGESLEVSGTLIVNHHLPIEATLERGEEMDNVKGGERGREEGGQRRGRKEIGRKGRRERG